MTELLLFVSTFVMVFALGLQSLNVNGGHYVAAALTSFLIAGGNLVVLKLIPGSASATEIVAYFCGGPLGIVASMLVHRRTIGKHRLQHLEAYRKAEREAERISRWPERGRKTPR